MSKTPKEITETITVENVVASTSTGRDLDLEALCMDMPESQFNPDNFPGLIYRSVDERVAALIFRSGKIVCTGADSIEQIHRVLTELEEKFDEIGLEHNDLEPTVQNVVGVADLGDNMNLNAIAIGLGLEETEYEPEQFPGLIYRGSDTNTVSLLFGSGKLVITGGKSTDNIEHGVEMMYSELDDLALM